MSVYRTIGPLVYSLLVHYSASGFQSKIEGVLMVFWLSMFVMAEQVGWCLKRSKTLESGFCLFVWVDALRPRSTAEVMSGRSVILSKLFLGKPPRGR